MRSTTPLPESVGSLYFIHTYLYVYVYVYVQFTYLQYTHIVQVQNGYDIRYQRDYTKNP